MLSFFFTSLTFFFFNATSTPDIYTLSLHDALPISASPSASSSPWPAPCSPRSGRRSEEHTSELQSRVDLVCRLLLEKKNTLQLENKQIHNLCSCLATSAYNDRQSTSHRHDVRNKQI